MKFEKIQKESNHFYNGFAASVLGSWCDNSAFLSETCRWTNRKKYYVGDRPLRRC